MAAFLLLSACNNNDRKLSSPAKIDSTSPTPSQTSSDNSTPTDPNISPSPTSAAVSTGTNEYYIIRDGYNKGKDIAVSYPQLEGLKDTNIKNNINELLKQDAMSYLDDASAIISLDISYEIKWKGDNLLSVEYYGWGEVSDAPHPDKMSILSNIDINTGKKISLQDVFHIDQKFIDSIINNGKYAGPMDPDDSDLMEEVKSGMSSSLTTSNLPNISFYFTRYSLGLIIDISHADGSYAMIETKYSDLKNNIVSNNDVWKDFKEAQDKDSDSSANDNQHEISYDRTLSDIDGFIEIKDQSFNVDLEGWGAVRFVSGMDDQGKLMFFLTDDKNTIRYQFSDFYDSYRRNQTVSAVAFRDVNQDNLKDIIVIAANDSGSTTCDIYFQTEYNFIQYPDLYHDLNQSDIQYDTIGKVMDYMSKSGNALVANFTNDVRWKQAYIEYINNTLINSWGGYELINLNDDDIPELVALGGCEAEGNLVCNYSNGAVNSTQLSRLGFSYIKGENLLCNSEGLMDYYYDIVYSIIDGHLTQIAAGYWGELDDTGHHFDKDGELIYEYSWNDVKVTRNEYKHNLNSVFDMSKATEGYMDQPYTADEIIKMIERY
jgi:hypothetical protein